MNSTEYLTSYGWKQGEALKKGGIKKPILVKYKQDTKGLGHDAGAHDAWWEKMFDSTLSNLDVGGKGKDISFKYTGDHVDTSAEKETSALYRMFVKGQGLRGTIGVDEEDKPSSVVIFKKSKKDKKDKKDKKVKDASKKDKKEKSSKKEKKEKSDKKEKKDKSEKKEKKEKSDKKEKKEKSEKKEKKEKKESKKDKTEVSSDLASTSKKRKREDGESKKDRKSKK